jgi:GntR family transcriptional regulator/MocR family aminotransferase
VPKPATDAIAPFIALEPGSAPLYQQIHAAYRAAILDGRLQPGQRVPSTRALARELGISRLPVLNAFEQLLHEGYIEGRVGSGTYIASSILDKAAGARSGRRAKLQAPPQTRVAAALGTEADANATDRTNFGAFRLSQPALDRFPIKTWSRLVSRHARRMTVASMAYGDPAGHLPFRDAIADYLRTARGVDCEAGQVVVVSGSQMALQLCARVLLTRGDTLCFEEPGYPGARDALRATGATLRPVPVDDDGLVVSALSRGKQPACAVYVTPSHQYPLGVSMNVARRLALLEWAQRCDAWIIEDDYDSEYRYASRPLGSLQGMDRASRVIYVGTFSKVMFPALRIGYLVVPPALVDRFIVQRRALDLFSPTLYQLALTDFLREGHFARHLRRMRIVYRKRHDALVDAIHRRLAGTLTIVNADAGMHLTALLPPDIDDRAVVRCAASRSLNAIALSSCHAGRSGRSGLVLGFGGASEGELERAVELLADAIEEARRG